ncbi:ParB/RepB/Spo0J family partition protein [Patescibacteria group bacterium]|nr:ParB/RepB/Spo0J family partition protein [Patescibacteria group bacterium]
MSLGRGLGALITPTTKRSSGVSGLPGSADKIWHIPLSEIGADPNQARKSFDIEGLQELAESIKSHGLLQPLLVSEKTDGGYELIAGERRLRAAKMAGLTTAPVMVKKMADQQKLEVALIENIQREDLNPIEEAFAYKRLMEEFDLTQDEVGTKVGKSRPAVGNAVRLLDLPEEVQAAVVGKKINVSQARSLLSLETAEKQLAMLSSMLGQRITVRELEREVSKNKKDKSHSRRDANLTYLEDKLRAALGTKVNITQKGDKGTVSIQYYSKEELGRLIKRMSE